MMRISISQRLLTLPLEIHWAEHPLSLLLHNISLIDVVSTRYCEYFRDGQLVKLDP